MRNITINSKKRTIEVTKSFAKAASMYGTAEYKDLQEVRKDYPNYNIVVKKTKSGDRMKGLDFDYMEEYIDSHPKNIEITYDDDTTDTISILAAFYQLCGKNSKGKDDPTLVNASYGEIKKWFLEMYPELKAKNKRTNAILSGSKFVKNNVEDEVA